MDNHTYDLKRFAVYHGNDLMLPSASFNHAEGVLYRSQPYGVEPEHGVFDIQRDLREKGRCNIGCYTAVSWVLTNGPVRDLRLVDTACRISRCGTSD